uniref:Vacuolar protein-sorting-associated protein 25 n=1 Tax=Strongyloides papillosus TaxID=174720 RepID=A0A0N5BW49_STREA
MANSTTFNFPWHYDFPPFYTIQPNSTTKEKQLEAWGRLVIDFCHHLSLYTVDLNELSCSELFCNQKLNRRLNLDGIKTVFEYLEQKEHIEWLDSKKTRCHVYWRTPSEWGDQIYEWASQNGLINSPCTLFELTQGEDTVKESFYGLSKDILIKSLQTLENKRKAVLMNIGTDSEGVKFLS